MKLFQTVAIAILSIAAVGCAATGDTANMQSQIDQALRASQEARAAADRAQVTADQAKALAEQAIADAASNSKKVDRAFVKSQQK